MEHKQSMRDVFNFMIMLTIVLWTYAVAFMREDHPNDGWGWLFWPLGWFAYQWGKKIKKDYK